jgi:hypothetical protein
MMSMESDSFKWLASGYRNSVPWEMTSSTTLDPWPLFHLQHAEEHGL